MKRMVYLIAAIAASAGFLSVPAITAHSAELSNKEKAAALLESLETGDPKPVGYINPDKYIQHNLMVKDGLAGFGELLQSVDPGGIKVRVVRAFSDGDYVFTHTDYDFFGPKAGFDIFRFEDGLIVRHWDNLAPKTRPNPSGRTQFDGPVKASDLDKTEANKALVRDFMETVLVRGQYEKMGGYFNGDNYLQHNPEIGDGLSGLSRAVKAMAEKGIKMVYEKIHLVLGEGNFVLSVGEGRFAGQAVAYYDLFRVENGKIAEHWDVIENIPPKGEWKNDNGKF